MPPQQLPPTDIQSIRNAAHALNSTLLSRTYIDENLQFNCINWKKLISDQLEVNPKLGELIITEKLYNNDKNTINLIHALVKIIDKQRSQQRVFNENILSKDNKIQTLEKQVQELSRKLHTLEKGNQNKVVKYNSLSKEINQLTKQNKIYSEDLQKVKNWTLDTKNKYKIEMKRKNLEIENLKNKLLEKTRNLPSNIEYGGNSDGLVIQNNAPIIENSTGLIINNPNLMIDMSSIITNEMEENSIQLVNIVESIAKENFKFTKFMSSIKEYFTKVNMSLSDFKYRDLETEKLPTPTDLIDLKEITADPETIKEYFTEIEPSEIIARTILNECYKLYHNIETLLNYISQNDPLDKDNESAIAKLQQDLEVMKSNWQDALKTSENWKKLAEQQQKHLST
ncbi:hypothetical protein MEM_02040 [Candida albicans L26]|uniref:Autophagy-related protein 25 n=4 Tax=Candida albicans TaxID=5476 RepID=A0A1D8PHN4_CANAL|nr:uncharacterized protein CAALFM_C206280CA [Candida albicans SC5314]EEQ46028.1 conserved hypothetical protein [Candida albicans WO-1]KAF6063583.1 Afadin- and alpha -actinin-Binding family protein [Candida albicans]KGQ96490.1 hypothetical protein MEU_02028 [Candida albicans P37005]KGR13616.1 hypothetical protein MG3_02045 [Candida albicans P78048]KGR20976.1 hypothetical protein MG9_02044 [Candida albicans P37037]KGT70813.1 hypothetical protein MEK_02058 [Candida albicans 12C]KGU11736.1 hypot|eukprot:XP_711483.2 hypothetical protein CAALFM_C206280CA [Candida albicans SC5314]